MNVKYYRKEKVGILLTIDLETGKEVTTDEIRKFIKDFFISFKGIIEKRKEIFYDFPKKGVTYVAILSESHIAIHTFPEINFISIDVYFCKFDKRLFKKIENFIINWFNPIKNKSIRIVKRGVNNRRTKSTTPT